jgi:hypothetical protein
MIDNVRYELGGHQGRVIACIDLDRPVRTDGLNQQARRARRTRIQRKIPAPSRRTRTGVSQIHD